MLTCWLVELGLSARLCPEGPDLNIKLILYFIASGNSKYVFSEFTVAFHYALWREYFSIMGAWVVLFPL